MRKKDTYPDSILPDVHEYELPGGWKVLVGKTDRDNDLLSIHGTDPDDWWFHVRALPGSHVILKARTGQDPDKETLRSAAAIAAYHSKARNAGITPVSCTRACNVSKPRRAKPGSVQIRKEVVLKVRPCLPLSIVDMP
jgi:predicted ribosome quality control (RQC) complex YloA/Tae2 family protein